MPSFNLRIPIKGSGRSYDGGKDMGDLKGWTTFASDPNKILKASYGKLQERSTTLYNTFPPAKSAINKQTSYGVGPGLIFRSKPDHETLGISKASAKDMGMEIQKVVDYYSRRFGFYENQSVLYRTAFYGGGSLLWFLKKDGKLDKLKETSNAEIDWKFNDDSHTLGIKHDKFLDAEGFKRTDGSDVKFKDSIGDQNVIQFYFKELASQLRGFPLIYSAINLSRNDDAFTDAITNRAVLEATLFSSFESNGTDIGAQIKGMADTNRKRQGKFTSGLKRLTNAANLGSGNIFTINSGEKWNLHDIKTPSNNYDIFKAWSIKYIGMATDTPPEVILSEYATSFTAHKGALNDFVKSYMKRRKTFERLVMDVVVTEFIKDAILQGFLKLPGFFNGGWLIQEAYTKGLYLGPMPGHINPLVEVKANQLKVDAGFDLRSKYANLEGHEWDSFTGEYESEQIEFFKLRDEDRAKAIYDQETSDAK